MIISSALVKVDELLPPFPHDLLLYCNDFCFLTFSDHSYFILNFKSCNFGDSCFFIHDPTWKGGLSGGGISYNKDGRQIYG